MAIRSFDKIRKHPRAPFTALVKTASGGQFPFSKAQNISEGGMFLSTKNPPPVGTRLALEFTVTPHGTAIAAAGEVVSSIAFNPASGNSSPYGMGIRFVDISPAAQEDIRRYVGAYKPAGPR